MILPGTRYPNHESPSSPVMRWWARWNRQDLTKTKKKRRKRATITVRTEAAREETVSEQVEYDADIKSWSQLLLAVSNVINASYLLLLLIIVTTAGRSGRRRTIRICCLSEMQAHYLYEWVRTYCSVTTELVSLSRVEGSPRTLVVLCWTWTGRKKSLMWKTHTHTAISKQFSRTKPTGDAGWAYIIIRRATYYHENRTSYVRIRYDSSAWIMPQVGSPSLSTIYQERHRREAVKR